MTQEEIIFRHAKRIADGWPAPTKQQLSSELRCAHSNAEKALDQINNGAIMICMERFCRPLNNEPVPEWRTR